MSNSADLRSIHDAFSHPVSWYQVGTVADDVGVVLFHDPGDDPIGVGKSVRQRGYEVPVDLLPFKPSNGDIINDGGKSWRIIDVQDYEEAEAWRVMVEKAS